MSTCPYCNQKVRRYKYNGGWAFTWHQVSGNDCPGANKDMAEARKSVEQIYKSIHQKEAAVQS